MGSEIGFSEDWLRQVGKELFQDRSTLMNLQEEFVKTIFKKNSGFVTENSQSSRSSGMPRFSRSFNAWSEMMLWVIYRYEISIVDISTPLKNIDMVIFETIHIKKSILKILI